jgi:predicted AAA+ superfamily ATPase
MAGFDMSETGAGKLQRLWLRGGFPRSFTAKNDAESWDWRSGFVRTFLERDMPQFGVRIPAPVMGRFWAMLAHIHGGEWNASNLASSFGVAHTTVRHYLDFLTATFMVRQLRPWHESLGKRQVKSPKVYFADTGVLHYQLDIRDLESLMKHPKAGPSWEGFAMEQVIARLGAEPRSCYFWATYSRAELDLLVTRGREKHGFEFKLTTAPVMTRSMHIALADLKLDSLTVVHAGKETWPMAPKVRAMALVRLLEDLKPL